MEKGEKVNLTCYTHRMERRGAGLSIVSVGIGVDGS
jgi:hypothetical protein